ncbi:MAG: peptidyl-prolyl cis-trans isomerase [Candidatus Coatesbacteria bacterium]|nr:peptidyl-prolyl cis-trans isomerase [Candidatus Coatesbacteria bacterium]
MKREIYITISLIFVLLLCHCTKKEEIDKTSIAIIKGKKGTKMAGFVAKISLKEFDEKITTMPPFLKQNYETTDGRTKFLQKEIDQKVMYLCALSKGYEKDSRISKLLKRNEDVSLLREFHKKKIDTLGDKPKEEELKAFYKKKIDDYTEKEKFQVSIVVIGQAEPSPDNKILQKKSERKLTPEQIKTEADNAAKELDKNAPFEKVVEKYSIDPYSLGRKGDLGIIAKGSYIVGIAGWDEAKELSATIDTLPVNKHSQPIPYKNRYYILKVTSKIPQKIKTFDEVKNQIKSSYIQDLKVNTYNKILEDLKKTNEIKISDEDLKKEFSAIKDKVRYPGKLEKDAPDEKTIIAKGKEGLSISLKDFREELENIPVRYRMMSLNDLDGLKKELERVIERQIVANQARKEGYQDNAGLIKSLLDYKMEVLSKEFYQKEIYEKSLKVPSEEEIKKEYEKSKDKEYSDKGYVEVYHIVCKTKGEAETIYKELSGQPLEKFKETAKIKSEDKTSAPQGGSLGKVFIDQDFMSSFLGKQPELQKEMLKLKAGEISQPVPVKAQIKDKIQPKKEQKPATKDYWVIVFVDKNVPTKIKPYDEVKDIIKKRLTSLDNGATNRAIFELRKDFDIIINKEMLVVKKTAKQLFDDAMQATSNPDKSIELFEQLIKEYPNDKNIEKAMFMLGFLYWEQKNDKEKGKKCFEDFLQKFPESQMAKDAKAYLDGTIDKNMQLINEGKFPDTEDKGETKEKKEVKKNLDKKTEEKKEEKK